MTTELLSRIVATVFPLVSLVGVGWLYARRSRPFLDDINTANMDLFTPALVFSILVGGDFTLNAMSGLAAATAAMVVLCALAAVVIARLMSLDWRVAALCLSFRNAGNIGLPLAVLAFGEAALPAATVVFLSANLIHFLITASLLTGSSDLRAVCKVPVVVVSAVALAVKALGVSVPETLMIPINWLGEIAIPLMLFSLGVRLATSENTDWRVGWATALSMPLVGLFAFGLIAPAFALPPYQFAALLTYAMLPTAVLNFMFAERYRYRPTEVGSVIVVSHVVALAILPLALGWMITHMAL